jgi:hypothetical protein
LRQGTGSAEANPLANFMYFVPLISPEPVSTAVLPGSEQWARFISASRHVTASTFTVTCEFEFVGPGTQESIFDLTREIRRHAEQLKAGKLLEHQLKSIVVNGPGIVSVEIEGTVSSGVRTVNEVRLHFNAHGQESPVTIALCDIQLAGGKYQPVNDLVARVNALTFRRAAGTPKMEVSLASIKEKDDGNTLWQNFKGRVKGIAANLVLPPLDVEVVGNQAMLDFGLALASSSETFTFPLAKNLVSAGSR